MHIQINTTYINKSCELHQCTMLLYTDNHTPYKNRYNALLMISTVCTTEKSEFLNMIVSSFLYYPNIEFYGMEIRSRFIASMDWK